MYFQQLGLLLLELLDLHGHPIPFILPFFNLVLVLSLMLFPELPHFYFILIFHPSFKLSLLFPHFLFILSSDNFLYFSSHLIFELLLFFLFLLFPDFLLLFFFSSFSEKTEFSNFQESLLFFRQFDLILLQLFLHIRHFFCLDFFLELVAQSFCLLAIQSFELFLLKYFLDVEILIPANLAPQKVCHKLFVSFSDSTDHFLLNDKYISDLLF